MTPTATARVLAVLSSAALCLSGCTGRAAGVAASAGALAPATTITWAVGEQPRQYNPDTLDGALPASAAVLGGVLSGFWRYAPDGTIQRNTEFGTYRKISDDPLTVRYTIDPRAVWSDGVPIDCDDVALAWLANSGATGDRGFAAVDVARYRDMNQPRCESGDKVFTVSYRQPFADWETAFGPGSALLMPAHVVERQAHLRTSFVDYLATPTSPDLAPAIAFWNTGWALVPGQVRRDLDLSSGPYLVDSWQGDRIVLKPNPRWWGRPPHAGTVVIRVLDAGQQAGALAAGQIQAMDPTPDAGVVAQLRGLGAKARVATGYRPDVEHLDFNLRGAFADRTLRQAFAKCVPRQQIVDQLVKPLYPGAHVLESRFLLPSQPDYPSFAAAGHPYDAVDIAGARQLLAGRTPTVRIGWRKDPEQPNPGRLSTIALLKASCARAGFTVVDAGTPTFFEREWPGGAYDVAMFLWTQSPTVTGDSDIYVTGGASNVGGYSNRQVDRLFGRLQREVDAGRQVQLLRQIDGLLWNDLATVPLYAYPALTATSWNVSGIVFNPNQEELTWNVADWRRS